MTYIDFVRTTILVEKAPVDEMEPYKVLAEHIRKQRQLQYGFLYLY